jgi:hypothetical protein
MDGAHIGAFAQCCVSLKVEEDGMSNHWNISRFIHRARQRFVAEESLLPRSRIGPALKKTAISAAMLFLIVFTGCSVQPGTKNYCYQEEANCRLNLCNHPRDHAATAACFDRCEAERKACVEKLPDQP